MENESQTTWPRGINTLTLFVEDLAAAKAFYQSAFELPVIYQDGESTVFRFGGTQVDRKSVV